MPSFRIAAMTAALMVSAMLSAQTGWPPDHTKANLGGKEGMTFFPVDDKGPIEPRNCTVQLAPTDALETRYTYQCGEWFLPPAAGSYRSWVELDGRVSGAQTILRYAGPAPFRGEGWVILHQTVPAGYVAVPQQIPAGHSVRYLSLDAPAFGFSLRVPAASASRAVSVPAGRIVAGIFRDDADEAVAHSRPLTVEAGKTHTMRITPPATGGDLLVMIRKPPGSPPESKASLRVRDASGAHAPDAARETPGWLVALWYGLPEGKVILSVDGAAFVSPETSIQVKSGTVTTARPELKSAGRTAK